MKKTLAKAALALAAVAAFAVVVAGQSSDGDAAGASSRETGTVKPVVEAASGDKKVEVVK
ncbi:hypothetical protein ABZ957_01230 [Streptomyces sp. NPDC046316]|uniref:hypothetical protein n=1 Tax=unclassified Streptomyces TaxID=2593676 RepID=UPI0033DC2C55